MASTYAQQSAARSEVVERINQNRKRLDTAQANIVTTDTDLGAMPAAYVPIFQDIEDAATANPGDAALQAAKAEKDLLVAEFTALRTRAQSMRTALEGL